MDTYTYDNADRLISQKQTINGQPEETIAANTYDELGQLIGKGVGGRTTRGRLQNVDYGYNIRGWLKTINNPEVIGNDLFTFRLHYTTRPIPLPHSITGTSARRTGKQPIATTA
ncbi:MAG TPA: hypothetical protein VF677_12080 [Flavobacterium sp.]